MIEQLKLQKKKALLKIVMKLIVYESICSMAWLEKDTQGAWHVNHTQKEGQLLSTMIAHDVSLSVFNATMCPELHQ